MRGGYKKREKRCQIPSEAETLNRLAVLSFMYPSLLVVDDHLPCFAINLSVTPEFAAAVAPPDLNE